MRKCPAGATTSPSPACSCPAAPARPSSTTSGGRSAGIALKTVQGVPNGQALCLGPDGALETAAGPGHKPGDGVPAHEHQVHLACPVAHPAQEDLARSSLDVAHHSRANDGPAVLRLAERGGRAAQLPGAQCLCSSLARATLSSKTSMYGAPRNPSSRWWSSWRAILYSSAAGKWFARATAGTWASASAREMSGSTRLPDVVTRSTVGREIPSRRRQAAWRATNCSRARLRGPSCSVPDTTTWSGLFTKT